jgi:glycosyltransferase involved in cell wall biosynthesis
VHANTSRAAFYAVKAAKKLNIPVVWHVRIPHRDILLDGFLAKRSSGIIVVSQAVKDRFSWLKSNKINVIYNGVDIRKFTPAASGDEARKKLGLSGSDIVIGTVGRLSSEKGLECLILAAQNLVKAHSGTKFLVIGDGNEKYRCFLQDKIKRLNLGPNFIFTGFREDVPEVLRCADIFCLPSLTEGFNRALLEAMACGLPVVATSAGGNVEIVRDGISGFLVPPGNPDMLVSAIVKLIQNKERAGNMGIEGRRIVEKKFSIEQNVEKTEKLYLDLMGRR